MPKLSKTVLISHEPGNVFDLVADIGRYPEFIKWIRSMKVIPAEQVGHVRHYRGEASVGFKGFSESFATDVTADPVGRTIEVHLAHGPFRRLHNRWDLEDDGAGGTRICFFIDYEFRNPVLSLLARANTELAVNKIMAAFRAEADRRYSPRAS